MRPLLLFALLSGCAGASELTDPPSDTSLQTCPVDACEDGCTDLDVDPFNCGECGTTCVIPQALAACEAGSCALASCELGWADCDNDPLNGCESEAWCIDGAACETTCGSVGAMDCADPCSPVCVVPDETCNLADDDCDGDCNEELEGCRQAVYRAEGSLGPLYGLDPAEAEALRQTVDSERYVDVMSVEAAGTVALFRCDKGNGKRLLTQSADCEGVAEAPDLQLGFVAVEPTCDGTPLFRLYDARTEEHLYTISNRERERAIASGLSDEGIVGHVWRAPR